MKRKRRLLGLVGLTDVALWLAKTVAEFRVKLNSVNLCQWNRVITQWHGNLSGESC